MSGFLAPTVVVWTAVLVAMAILAFALAGERRRRTSAGSMLRRVALGAALLGLLGMALRPSHRGGAGGGTALLWTPGAAAESADPAAAERFAVGSGAALDPQAARRLEGWQRVADARTLFRNRPDLGRLRALGDGLRAWDWEGYRGVVESVPGPIATGFAAALWPRPLDLGEALRVDGRLVGLPRGAGKVLLEGPGGREAERAWQGPGEHGFSLSALPTDAGRQTYRLRAIGPGGAELLAETLDVVVAETAPPAVLWLESAPRFESRAVKAWLAERGGELEVRSRISRDRFRLERRPPERRSLLPHPGDAKRAVELDAGRLAPALLSHFDAVVLDAGTLHELAAGEASALATAVREQGLGVLVLVPEGDALRAVAPLELAARPLPGGGRRSARLHLDAGGQAALPPLDIEARELAPVTGGVALAVDEAGHWLAAAQPLGAGMVATTLVHGTERWVLEGNAVAQRRYWARLLGAVARRAIPPGGEWTALPGPLRVDEPLDLILTLPATAGALPPSATLAEAGEPAVALPLRRDPVDGHRWHAVLWPRRAGWLRVDSGAGARWEGLASAASSWTVWDAAARRDATALRAARGGPARETSTAGVPVPYPRGFFFALFLLGVAVLWARERLRGV